MLPWIGGSALVIVIGGFWILRRHLVKQQAEEAKDRARLQRVTHDAAQRSIAAADYGKFSKRKTDDEDSFTRGRSSRLSGRQDLRGPRHGR